MKALIGTKEEMQEVDMHEHTYDTGSKGFMGYGKIEIEGAIYIVRVQMIDKESVPPKDVRVANKEHAVAVRNADKRTKLEAALAKLEEADV